MSELKPCPFCGGKADIDAPTGSRNDRLVYCKTCFASICGDATPDAIAAWNRRAASAQSGGGKDACGADGVALPDGGQTV
jgi:Lar family restriction alleviation protein